MTPVSKLFIAVLVTLPAAACGAKATAAPDAKVSNDSRDAAPIDTRVADAAVADAPVATPGSLLFDGTDDFAQIPGIAAISSLSEVTVEAWVKPMGPGASRMTILDKPLTVGSQFQLYRESDGRLFGTTWSGNSGTNPSTSRQADLVVGTWSHVALTFRNGTLAIYVNGTLVGSSPSAQMSTSVRDLLLGKNQDGTAAMFKGAIDEIRIWNTARSQAELQANRMVALQGNEAHLVGYWACDEGTGDLVHDRTANQNTGRLGASVGSDAADPTWSSDTPF